MKYKVILSAHGNIDHGENPYKPLFPEKEVQADSIEECQKIVRNFIDETDIGGGNWTGGKVYDLRTGEKVGYISYNGRFWPNK